MLAAGLQSALNETATVINMHALPRILRLNGMNVGDGAAELVPGRVEQVDLDKLSAAVLRLSQRP